MSRRRYLSGRETELKLGVSNFTGNSVALEVTEGRVGFGTTTAYHQLTVNGDMQIQNELYDFKGSPGVQGLSLVSTGASVVWGTPEITFGGITIVDEGVVVGSAGSVDTINFVGDNITAIASGNISTITVDPFDPLGENTYVQYNDNGSFGGAEGLVFNKTLNKVGVGSTSFGSETLYVTGSLGVSGETNVEKVFVSDRSPTQPNELASKEYVDLFATAALVIQQAVAAGSTANITGTYVNGPTAGIGNSELGIGASFHANSNGLFTLDGFTPVIDDRVLIKNQSTEYENGFYRVKDTGSASAPWILERTADFDQPDEIVAGAFTFVTNGEVNQANGFVLIDIVPSFLAGGYVGFSTLEFTQFSAAGQVNAGEGLYKVDSTINVGTASSDRIRVNEDDIDLAVVSTSDTFANTDVERYFVTQVETDGYGRVTGITSDKHRFASSDYHGIIRVEDSTFVVNPVSGIITAANYFNVANINLPLDAQAETGVITARMLKGINIDSNGDIIQMRHADFTGIVSATRFLGDGSGLTDILTGVGLQTTGGYVGSGATTLEFRGPGLGVVTVDTFSGIGTINIEGGRDIDEIGDANQVLFKDSTNTATTSANLQFNGTNLTCAGTVTANSDERLKKNVKTIDDALDKIRSLRGVEYDHKNTGDHCLGLIAQEVEAILPDVVYEDAMGVKSVAYQNIVAVLIEAMKDQQRQIDELRRQLG